MGTVTLSTLPLGARFTLSPRCVADTVYTVRDHKPDTVAVSLADTRGPVPYWLTLPPHAQAYPLPPTH